MARPASSGADQHERLLRVLAVATFIIFFQAFMVAPIIPRLAEIFGEPVQAVGFIVPAYLIPYGTATLIYGFLADRLGLWRIMFGSLLAFTALTALTATATSIEAIAVWRVLTGLGASGVVPLALVLVGRTYPYEQRGRPLGWLFGAMAGGMAFGSTFGAVLEPLLGWRGVFVGVAVAGGTIAVLLLRYRALILGAARPVTGSLGGLFGAYRSLLSSGRGSRTYAFVFLNSVFHSGIFTWLGLYFERRYALGPTGIGLALLGYGIPGFLFGPLIGRLADRHGRGRLIPLGLAIGALSAALLALDLPMLAAAAAVTALSLGYDMTQPLFAGIVTALGGDRSGQAMGLNVFLLFVGFGAGSIMFGELLPLGIEIALLLFAGVAALLAIASAGLFAQEVPVRTGTRRT